MLTTVCEGAVTLRCLPRFVSPLKRLCAENTDSLCATGAFDRIFHDPGELRGRAATAFLDLPDGSERILVRQLKRGGWLGPWLGRLGTGEPRARRELDVTRALFERGAPVPEPALLLTERGRGCAVGTTFLDRSLDGFAFLTSEPRPAELRAGLRACAESIRVFHDLGGRHPDLQLKNLLVTRGEGWRGYVIDLDGASCGAPPEPERRMRELMRLYRSLAKRSVLRVVGREGVALFLSAYCAAGSGDPKRELRRALWRALPREWRRVTRHALLYRGGPASVRLPPRRAV